MIHAYNKVYVNTVMHNLAALFDIAINAENLSPDEFAMQFVNSDVAKGIERGYPDYLCGKSATELLSIILGKAVGYTRIPLDRSPEYWAGWVFAYTQWYLDRSFGSILSVISFGGLISMYHPYHEADESKTALRIAELFEKEPPLKRIRQKRKISQKQLSEISGVHLRSIQCYEQGDIDIGKAQADTLLALSKALDCSIEDLLK